MSRIRKHPPGVDPKLLVKDAAKLMPDPGRRAFLRGGASLGALAFLTGCDIVDGPTAERALIKVSKFNDRVQAWLFNPNKLAPTYPESAVKRPFPFNAYYPEEDAPEVDSEDYRLEVGGMVETSDRGRSPSSMRCRRRPRSPAISASRVGARSASGRGRGARVPAPGRRRHKREIRLVSLRRGLFHLDRHADRAASTDADDVPVRRGDPAAQVRLPHEGAHADQARFKNPKHVMELAVTNKYLGGYWEDQGYNWFSGV